MSWKGIKHRLVCGKECYKGLCVNLRFLEFMPIPFITISSNQVHMACL